jgi:hypothetical protein
VSQRAINFGDVHVDETRHKRPDKRSGGEDAGLR